MHDEPSIVVGVGPPRPGPVDHVLGRIRTEAERLAARAEGIEGRDWLRCGRRPSGQQVSAMDLVRHAVHVGAHHRTVMEGVMAAVLLRPDSAGDRAQTDKGGSAMRRTNTAESGSDRVALAKDAGMGRISLFGVLAGTLVAYGAFLVLASVVAAVANAVGVSDKVATLNWEEMGVTAGLIVAAVLLLSYLFGGYVAGRMARRAGALNGFLVFVLGVLVAVGVSLLVNLIADGDEAARNFRNAGIPTSGEEWGNAGTVAGIASLLAIVIGPILGGILGERWHAKLVHRALDPTVGAEARHRQQAQDHQRGADERHQGAEARTFRPAPPPRSEAYGQPHEDTQRHHEGARDAAAPVTAAEEPDDARQSAWGAKRPWAKAEREGRPAAPPGGQAGVPDEGGPRVTRRTGTRPPG